MGLRLSVYSASWVPWGGRHHPVRGHATGGVGGCASRTGARRTSNGGTAGGAPWQLADDRGTGGEARGVGYPIASAKSRVRRQDHDSTRGGAAGRGPGQAGDRSRCARAAGGADTPDDHGGTRPDQRVLAGPAVLARARMTGAGVGGPSSPGWWQGGSIPAAGARGSVLRAAGLMVRLMGAGFGGTRRQPPTGLAAGSGRRLEFQASGYLALRAMGSLTAVGVRRGSRGGRRCGR